MRIFINKIFILATAFITIPLTFPAIILADTSLPVKTDIIIGDFSSDTISGWEEKEFSGKTNYKLVKQDNRIVLQANAVAAASGLFKEIEIDLTTHPYLNWEWKVDKIHSALAERTKAGDDYAARIYVIINGGVFFWKTKAINYVWASSEKKESVWPNAFAGENAMLVAIRSNTDANGTWYQEKRNVYQDLKNVFGEEITKIDAIAIMTDSDNSQGEAQASYGDISFTSH